MDPTLDYALWLTINDLAEPWIAALQSGAWKPEGREAQLAFALRALEGPRVARVLGTLLGDRPLPRDGSGPWIEVIGSAGAPDHLGRLLRQVEDDGFEPAAAVRALKALGDAARLRQAKPDGDRLALKRFLTGGDAGIRAETLRLAGLWKEETFVEPLVGALSARPPLADAEQALALESLRQIGGAKAIAGLGVLAGEASGAPALRRRASVALAGLDATAGFRAVVEAAATLADEPGALEYWRAALGIKGSGLPLRAASGRSPAARGRGPGGGAGGAGRRPGRPGVGGGVRPGRWMGGRRGAVHGRGGQGDRDAGDGAGGSRARGTGVSADGSRLRDLPCDRRGGGEGGSGPDQHRGERTAGLPRGGALAAQRQDQGRLPRDRRRDARRRGSDRHPGAGEPAGSFSAERRGAGSGGGQERDRAPGDGALVVDADGAAGNPRRAGPARSGGVPEPAGEAGGLRRQPPRRGAAVAAGQRRAHRPAERPGGLVLETPARRCALRRGVRPRRRPVDSRPPGRGAPGPGMDLQGAFPIFPRRSSASRATPRTASRPSAVSSRGSPAAANRRS
jgi:hypothetical protein